MRVTDNGVPNMSDEETFQVQVNNVAPGALSLQLSPAAIDENGVVTLDGTFADPGVLDTHTVSIAWGDGLSDTIPLARTY